MADVVLPHQFQDGIGQVASGDDVMDDLNAIVDQVNGNLDSTNLLVRSVNADRLSDVLARLLAVSNGSVAPRGKSIVTGQDSTASTAYVLGATHDEVTVDAPADGMLWIAGYLEAQAGTANGKVGLFVNGQEVLRGIAGNGPAVSYETVVLAGAFWQPLATANNGFTTGGQFADPPGTIATAGLAMVQAIGIQTPVAGPVTVSMRYAAGTSGTLSFRNRRLFVEAKAY